MSIVGHAEQIGAFQDAAQSGKLHHAWLLAGPQGIGKARFADLAAAWLLARAADPALDDRRFELEAGSRTAALIAAGSHPDLKRLARLAKDRSEELARSISVDQVRSLLPLFATTPSLSPTRVVIIDALDDLERSAANALLKNLEEPPTGTTFLLVSHAPGRLLPTIRSRCRLLRFGRLDAVATAEVLRTELPHADAGEIAALVKLSNGAPGTAVGYAGLDLEALDGAIDRLARGGDPSNAERATLARNLSGKTARQRYEAFLERAPARIAAAARVGEGDRARLIELWQEARSIADGAVRLSLEPQLTVFELAGLVAALAPEGARAKA